MDDNGLRDRFEQRLGTFDWSRGLTKAGLGERLADDGVLRFVVARSLPEGTYFSPRDVLNALPATAWQDIPADAAPRAAVPAAGQQESAAAGGDTGPVGQARQVAGRVAQGVAGTATKVAEQTRERAAAAAQAAGGVVDLSERVRKSATEARDQVLHVRTRPAEPSDSSAPETASPAGGAGRPPADTASTLIEGGAQASSRPPTRALVLAGLALALGAMTGLSAWLARRSADNRRLGEGLARWRPFLLGLWGAVFVGNLWDAWQQGRAAAPLGPTGAAPGTALPSAWEGLAPEGRSSPVSPTSATDQYPTVGNA